MCTKVNTNIKNKVAEFSFYMQFLKNMNTEGKT